MYLQFPLFQSHLDLAHSYWKQVLKPGSVAIDATCGNGLDALFIASSSLTASDGILYAIDVQQQALDITYSRLQDSLGPAIIERVRFIHGSHEHFPAELQPASVDLIVYNLGYLPKGDKTVTTISETTLKSIDQATDLIKPGGMISITCYPGHREGAEEEKAVCQWSRSLPPRQWSCCFHQWTNRNKAPSLLILQRGSDL
jgi:hypothetical protein